MRAAGRRRATRRAPTRSELDEPAPLADQLAAIGDGGADIAGDQADVVGHVGQHGRVAEAEQGGEGDQRPRPDDHVMVPAASPAAKIARASSGDMAEGLAPEGSGHRKRAERRPVARSGPTGTGKRVVVQARCGAQGRLVECTDAGRQPRRRASPQVSLLVRESRQFTTTSTHEPQRPTIPGRKEVPFHVPGRRVNPR